MIVINIVTTGPNPEKHQILEFAAIYDNSEPIKMLPRFVRKIWWSDFIIDSNCLKLHLELLKEITERKSKNIIHIGHLTNDFYEWLHSLNIYCPLNVTTYNNQFLEKIPAFPIWTCRTVKVDNIPIYRALPDVLSTVAAIRRTK